LVCLSCPVQRYFTNNEANQADYKQLENERNHLIQRRLSIKCCTPALRIKLQFTSDLNQATRFFLPNYSFRVHTDRRLTSHLSRNR
jgi:hypothetical protein